MSMLKGFEFYYNTDRRIRDTYDNGQFLLFTPKSTSIHSLGKLSKTSVVIVEKMKGYEAKFPTLKTETEIDPYYPYGEISFEEVEPISLESHPEIFIKLGFVLYNID